MEQALVQKFGQVLDGGVAKYSPDGGNPAVPPEKKNPAHINNMLNVNIRSKIANKLHLKVAEFAPNLHKELHVARIIHDLDNKNYC